MAVADQLASARAAVETTLTDTCTITNDPGGFYNDTFNPADGSLTPSALTTIYSGPCSVRTLARGPGASVELTEDGDQIVGRITYRITLPHFGTEAVAPGQLLTLNSSDDSSLVGKDMTVRHVVEGPWEPSRRIVCEDRISGSRLR